MTRISPARDAVPETADDEAGISGASPTRLRWKIILTWLLRMASIICMLRAMIYWMELLGLFNIDFTDRVLAHQVAIVFFAASYCLAATGLWMTAAWGAVLWFIVLCGEGLLIFLEPGFRLEPGTFLSPQTLLGSPGYLLSSVALFLAFIVLSWLAARE